MKKRCTPLDRILQRLSRHELGHQRRPRWPSQPMESRIHEQQEEHHRDRSLRHAVCHQGHGGQRGSNQPDDHDPTPVVDIRQIPGWQRQQYHWQRLRKPHESQHHGGIRADVHFPADRDTLRRHANVNQQSPQEKATHAGNTERRIRIVLRGRRLVTHAEGSLGKLCSTSGNRPAATSSR